MAGANCDVMFWICSMLCCGESERQTKINKVVLMYKILNNHSAPDLKDKFNRRETNLNDYNLRNASVNLPVPKPNSEYLKKKRFGYSGAALWNSLSAQARLTESVSSFKNLISMYPLSQQSNIL